MESLNHSSWERSGLEGYGRPQPYILGAKWLRRLWKASTIHLGSEVVEKAMEGLNHTSWSEVV